MTTIRPATLHHGEDPRLAEVAAALIDAVVTGVRYLLPAGVGLNSIDDVDLGVELVFGPGRALALQWATPGIEEGLAIAVGAPGVDESLVDRVDVTDDPHWSGIIGHRVETLAVAFFHPDGDSPVRPWSFRVGVTGGSSVTMALGEHDGPDLRYQPDNLVVLFGEAAARAYRIVGALEPAWGSPLAHGTNG